MDLEIQRQQGMCLAPSLKQEDRVTVCLRILGLPQETAADPGAEEAHFILESSEGQTSPSETGNLQPWYSPSLQVF